MRYFCPDSVQPWSLLLDRKSLLFLGLTHTVLNWRVIENLHVTPLALVRATHPLLFVKVSFDLYRSRQEWLVLVAEFGRLAFPMS